MLDGYLLSWRGEVEHVEDDRFATAILAAVDSADNLDQRLAFAEGLLGAVLTDDGQLALLHDAVVHDGMVMPAGLSADRKVQADNA